MNKQASLNFLRKLRAELREMSDDEFLRQFAELSRPDEGEGWKKQVEAAKAILNTYAPCTGPLLHDDVFRVTNRLEAQAEALAQALEDVMEDLRMCITTKTMPALSDNEVYSVAHRLCASYRSGNPPRKSVPLVMLEEFCQIEETVPIERIVIFFKQRGYEVTE